MLMKFLNKLFYLIPLVLFFSGCTKDEPKGLSDAELILAIIDAENKIEVDMESLPMVARSTMEDNYFSEYYHLNTYKASTIGYEVFIAGKPGRLGKRSEVYFDITGNKLDYAEYERVVMSNDDNFYNGDESGDRRDWDCFTIQYPITVTLSDGYTYTFESEEAVKEYYDAYEIDEEMYIAFPISVIGNDGEAIVIENDEALKEVYRGCYSGERDIVVEQKCFSLVYPVSYQLPDGSLIEVLADNEDSWAEMNAWYDENPESAERPTLQYPVVIMYEEDDEGSEDALMVTVNNEEEMIIAREDCRELEFDDVDDCYEYSYPITYMLPDDSTVEIASSNDENAWGLIRRFYEENPEAEGEPILQFPIEIIFQGDMVFVFETNAEYVSFVEENCNRQD